MILLSLEQKRHEPDEEFRMPVASEIKEERMNAYARRAQAIRYKVSDKEWDRIVKRWSEMLHAGAEFLHSTRHRNYHGPLSSLAAIGGDATRIIWVPVLYVVCDRPALEAGRMIVGSVPSVLSDAAVAFPSSILKARYKFSFRRTGTSAIC